MHIQLIFKLHQIFYQILIITNRASVILLKKCLGAINLGCYRYNLLLERELTREPGSISKKWNFYLYFHVSLGFREEN